MVRVAELSPTSCEKIEDPFGASADDDQSISSTDVGSSSGQSRTRPFVPTPCAPKSFLRHVTFAFGDIGDEYAPLQDGTERPKENAFAVYRELSEWWQPTHSSNTKSPPSLWRRYGVPFAAVLAYYVIGCIFYKHRGWTLLDSIYFSTVLMMTVGYGDQVPHGDCAIIFTAIYALLAVTLVAAAVTRLWDTSVLLNVLNLRRQQNQNVRKDLASLSRSERLGRSVRKKVSKTIRGLLKPAEGVALLDKEAHRRRKGRVLFASVVAFLFWVFLGTVANAWLRDLPDAAWKGSHYVKGFYFSVITLTTVGFGDFVPKSTGGKVFDIFYILIGVPISVNALGQIVRSIYGEDAEAQHVDLVKGLNEKKLQTMLQFQMEMFNAGCRNDVDGQVSRFEFMMFVLFRNGIVDMDTMKAIMQNFDELDTARTNALEVVDLQVRLSQSDDGDESGEGELQDEGDMSGRPTIDSESA